VAGEQRPYRRSAWRRVLNALVRPLARLGLAGRSTYVLTVRGRTSGKLWSTPVSIVEHGDARWLVAPYGERNWVKNARAAGSVELQRGWRRDRLAVEEVDAVRAVPVLREYYRRFRVTRPFFGVTLDSSDSEWLAEARRHPAFRLGSP
jgi:deazaflavin-dependent oxidoreductase (nitroreductase family)